MIIALLTGLTLAALPKILIGILIVALFLAGVYYVVTTFIPEPIRRYVWAVVVVIAVVVLILLLLPLTGYGTPQGLSR